MPAKKKKATKQTEEPQNQPSEDEVTEGFPDHGDEINEPEPQNEPGPEPEPEPEPEADPLEQIRAEVQELKRENQRLQQMIPPNDRRQEHPQPSQKKQEDEPDWERLLFENPNEALRLHGERVREQVRSELQTEYQRDQGTQRFWTDFYKKNPDLEEDRDLVELTLNSNLSNLANLPVAEAIEQLADLTRQRILRYSGGGQQKSRQKKPVVEGAESPKPKPPKNEEPNVTSLSDLIKARKAKRTTAA